MSQHTEVGDISLPVGSYTKKDQSAGKRGRKIGTLMKTVDGEGERFWIKIHGETLNPSLLTLMHINGLREKGSDTVIANVYPPRDERRPASSTSDEPL